MAQPQQNSVQWIVLRLLAYLGVTSLAAPPPATDPGTSLKSYVTPGLVDDLVGYLNAALQAIALDGPATISEREVGLAVFAPATIALSVVQGDAATVPVSGWQDWMTGCTVAIAGDGFQNEFVNGSGRLKRPYLGPTAESVSATVFGNAARLPLDVKNVIGSVLLGGVGELVPCTTRAEFDERSGATLHGANGTLRQGCPCYFFVENSYDETLPYLPLTMRFSPSPTRSLPVTFRAKLNPPTITVDDVGDDDADPVTLLPGVAGAYVEAIFLPYCLQLLTGHPLWKPDNPNAAAEIARRYTEARKKLAEFGGQASGSAGGYANTGRSRR